jgi:hypothetical protein
VALIKTITAIDVSVMVTVQRVLGEWLRNTSGGCRYQRGTLGSSTAMTMECMINQPLAMV